MKNKLKGQILIIALMLIGTVITIILSISFKSNVETELTRLEEENQKALAAAQAGIEEVLRKKTSVIIGGESGDILTDSPITGNAEIQSLRSNSFTTPLLKKDEQYTFYLAEYNPETHTFDPNTILNQDLIICFPSNMALEITLLKNDGSLKKRYIVDLQHRIQNAQIPNNFCQPNNSFDASFTIYKNLDIENDAYILIVRALFNEGSVFFTSNTTLPSQGKIVVSQVKTASGVTKKIKFFQSYPQIPAEFFVTSF